MNRDLVNLAREYYEAKIAEGFAIAHRRDLAAQIQAMTGHCSEEQSTYDAGQHFKVVVKAPLIRSMDWKQWDVVKEQIDPELWPVETKKVLDEKGVKWLETNKPEIYCILSECLTVKPGAVQVTIKPINQEK